MKFWMKSNPFIDSNSKTLSIAKFENCWIC